MFNPVNRHILIEKMKSPDKGGESLVVLPETYKPQEERYIEVVGLAAAPDVRFSVDNGSKLVVDRSMIEEISIGGTIYNVILDNYVVGVIE